MDSTDEIFFSQKLLRSAIIIALTWLAGCAGMDQSLPADAPVLTAEQEIKVGSTIEDRLLQLLGGPRHDQVLLEELDSLLRQTTGDAGRLTVSVADRNVAALYVLPGGRVVMTRGLLAEMRDLDQFKSLLESAAALTETAYSDRANRATNKAVAEILSLQESVYDPASGSIRLARIFAQRPCQDSCLTNLLQAGVGRSGELPEAIRMLKALQPAYQLLAEARRLEKAEDTSQAITRYLDAAIMASDEPQILGSLGMAYLRAGELQTARLNLQKAVRLQPDYYRTRMGLGYLYLQQGKVSQANDELAESVRLLPVTENLFLLAEAREKGGDVEGGLSLYRLIVDKDPHSTLGRTAARRLAHAKGVQ
ncbi:MAG: tetratricopeptide repeat protein [Desulfuromonadales bacterium]